MSNWILLVCLCCLIPPLALLIWFGWRSPYLLKIAWRNIHRRKATALFIVMGALIGTALLSSAFAVGDTLQHTIYTTALDTFGELDEVIVTQAASDQVSFFSVQNVQSVFFPESILDFLNKQKNDTIESYLPAMIGYMSAEKIGPEGQVLDSEPWVTLLGTRIDNFRTFTKNPGIVDFTIDECAVSDKLADAMGLEVGSELKLYLWGVDKSFIVRQIIPAQDFPSVNLESYAVLINLSSVYNYLHAFKLSLPLVSEQYLEDLTADSWIASDVAILRDLFDNLPPNPLNIIMVSNRGDRYEGVFASEQTKQLLESYLQDYQAQHPDYAAVDFLVHATKSEAKETADQLGTGFTALFLVLSGFSLIAGIVLLVNIFTLLAEERKKEIGILRATGSLRRQATQIFLIEGIFYSIVASLLGALCGVLFTQLLAVLAQKIVIGTNFLPLTLDFSYRLQPEHFWLAVAIGTTISYLTVLVTSIRIGRLNIIACLKRYTDDSQKSLTKRSWFLIFALLLLGLVGLAVSFFETNTRTLLQLISPCLILSALAWWGEKKQLGNRWVSPILIVILLYALASGWQAELSSHDYLFFLTIGIVSMFSLVTLVVRYQGLFVKIFAWLLSFRARSKATLKLAFAYQLDSRLRSALTLFVYVVVFLSITLTSVVRAIQLDSYIATQKQALQGYDLELRFKMENPFFNLEKTLKDNPYLNTSQIARIDAQPVLAASLRSNDDNKDYISATRIIALTSENISSYDYIPLSTRKNTNVSEKQIWQSVLSHPDEIIVGQLQNQYLAEKNLDINDQVLVCSSAGQHICLPRTIKAFSDGIESYASLEELTADFHVSFERMQSAYLVEVAEGQDISEVEENLKKAFSAAGAQVVNLHEQLHEQLTIQQTFYTVLQLYLTIGLVIGVSGLAVIMIRSVHERRYQIGLVRALGFQRKQVALGYLLESGLISFLGLATGLVLGLVLSFLLYSKQVASMLGSEANFVVPYTELALLFAIGFGLSLLAGLYPAYLASKVPPAKSLRSAE